MIRDFECSFTDVRGQQAAFVDMTGVGSSNFTQGVALAPNSIDMGPFGSMLTELSPNDQVLMERYPELLVRELGQSIALVIQWLQAPVASIGTTATVRMQLVTGTDKDQFNNVPETAVIVDLGAIPTTAFSNGTRQVQRLPGSNAYRQYLAVQALVTGGPLTAGRFMAWLGLDVDSEISGYANGVLVK